MVFLKNYGKEPPLHMLKHTVICLLNIQNVLKYKRDVSLLTHWVPAFVDLPSSWVREHCGLVSMALAQQFNGPDWKLSTGIQPLPHCGADANWDEMEKTVTDCSTQSNRFSHCYGGERKKGMLMLSCFFRKTQWDNFFF